MDRASSQVGTRVALGLGPSRHLPSGLVTLILPTGGVCLFPPWLINNPWGDFRLCQHLVPVNFLPVGSVSLAVLPDPVRCPLACAPTHHCPVSAWLSPSRTPHRLQSVLVIIWGPTLSSFGPPAGIQSLLTFFP